MPLWTERLANIQMNSTLMGFLKLQKFFQSSDRLIGCVLLYLDEQNEYLTTAK